MHQEISLNTIYGNQFRISAPEIPNGCTEHPNDTFLLMFEEKGIVIQKSEIARLKKFLETIEKKN